MRYRPLPLSCVLLVGCNAIFGLDEPFHADAGATGTTSTGDGGASGAAGATSSTSNASSVVSSGSGGNGDGGGGAGGGGGTGGVDGSGGGSGVGGGGGAEPTCEDGVANGDESDVDCGGPCDPCSLGQGCETSADCVEPDQTLCDRSVCAPPVPIGQWTRIASSGVPAARQYFGLAYHAERQRTFLFGGAGTLNTLNDLYSWAGSGWDVAETVPTVTARESMAMAYDPIREDLVVFGGGVQLGSPRADTWIWDDDWFDRGVTVGLEARSGPAAAWDSVSEEVLLFGGQAAVAMQDTWSWDGRVWTERTPDDPPPARTDHGMASDTVGGRVLMFGGAVGASLFDDTWAWDGAQWDELLIEGPAARRLPGMTFDSIRGRVVLFGGGGGAALADTWELDGAQWVQTSFPSADTPPAQNSPKLAFDERRAVVVGVMPNTNEVWEYYTLATPCADDMECGNGQCVDGLCCSDTACVDGEDCNTVADPGNCAAP